MSADPVVIEAALRSKCAACGGWIEEGDEIAQSDDGEWLHVDCALEDE